MSHCAPGAGATGGLRRSVGPPMRIRVTEARLHHVGPCSEGTADSRAFRGKPKCPRRVPSGGGTSAGGLLPLGPPRCPAPDTLSPLSLPFSRFGTAGGGASCPVCPPVCGQSTSLQGSWGDCGAVGACRSQPHWATTQGPGDGVPFAFSDSGS